jgi:hypothetical protein
MCFLHTQTERFTCISDKWSVIKYAFMISSVHTYFKSCLINYYILNYVLVSSVILPSSTQKRKYVLGYILLQIPANNRNRFYYGRLSNDLNQKCINTELLLSIDTQQNKARLCLLYTSKRVS